MREGKKVKAILVYLKYDVGSNEEKGGCKPGLSNVAPASAMALVIYFPGALIYSAGFNINQNFKKKIFLNNSMFQFFS
jgi:hypothetical protein